MKFCPRCGTQLQDESIFCFKCGANTESSAPFTPAPQAPPPVQGLPVSAPRKKSKVLAIVLPIVLIVLLAAGACLYFFVFNTPVTAFINANRDFFEKSDMCARLGEIEERIKKEDFESSQSVSITDIPGLENQIKSFVSNIKINMDTIKTKNEGGINYSLNMGDAGLAKLTALVSDSRLYAGISGQEGVKSASYVKLPGDEKTSLLQRLFYLIIKSEPDGKIEKLLGRLKDYTLQSLDISWFSIKPGSYNDIMEGGKVNANALTLSMDGERFGSFVSKLAQKLDSDPDFYGDLEGVVSDIPNAPKDFVKNMRKSLNEFKADKFGDSGLEWTAYQVGGKTKAIDLSLDIEKEDTKANISMELQKYKKDDTGALMLMLDVDRGKPDMPASSITGQILTTDKEDGCDVEFDLNMDSSVMKYGLHGAGEALIDKKGANSYDVKTVLDLTIDTEINAQASGMDEPAGAEQNKFSQKISLTADSRYKFGSVSYANSEYFDLEELESKAVKEPDFEKFMASFGEGVSQNMGTLLNMEKLIPSLTGGLQPAVNPETTDNTGQALDASALTGSVPLKQGIYETFLSLNSGNWFIFDFITQKIDNSLAVYKYDTLVIPYSGEGMGPALFSKPVSFNKGDIINIYRQVSFENKAGISSGLNLYYVAPGGNMLNDGILLARFTYGKDKFEAFINGQEYKKTSEIPAITNQLFGENFVIDTVAGTCEWAVGSTERFFDFSSLENGSVFLGMQTNGDSDSGAAYLTLCSIYEY